MTADCDALRKLFGAAELRWFLELVRNRLERGNGLRGSIDISSATAEGREALAKVFGLPELALRTSRVSLPKLESCIRQAHLAAGLEEVVTVLSGPLVNRRLQRQDSRREWEQVYDAAAALVSVGDSWRAWLAALRASGLLRRLSGNDPAAARRLLEEAHAVASRLPAAGVLLSELAAGACGDSHALDEGRPLGTLCARLVAVSTGANPDSERRDLWACAGVQCDDLSAPVLVLNLRAAGSGTLPKALAIHADSGEPYRISVRQLLRESIAFDAAVTGARVFVCENPSIVSAAADRLGSDSAPLVSIEGEARTAARLLLERLSAAGIELLYHGDFDWKGIGIANRIAARHGAKPWLFDRDAYERSPRGLPLEGAPVAADWDVHLAPAMQKAGYAVHEEQVLDELLRDLAR